MLIVVLRALKQKGCFLKILTRRETLFECSSLRASECPRGNRQRSPRRLGGLTGVGVGSPVLGRDTGGERGDLGSASLEGSPSKVRPGPWGWWRLPARHLGDQCRAARAGVSWAYVRAWGGQPARLGPGPLGFPPAPAPTPPLPRSPAGPLRLGPACSGARAAPSHC